MTKTVRNLYSAYYDDSGVQKGDIDTGSFYSQQFYNKKS